MKVVLVNHSDTRGGASVVTTRLMHALRAEGIDARMLVMHSATDDPNIEVLQPGWLRKVNFLYECADIYLHNGLNRDTLFQASIAVCGMPIHKHPWIMEADVVVLNWVNQGMLSLREIQRIKAPIVWTMHDMWCMTGVCHHAGECSRFGNECGHCPLMHGGTTLNDMSFRTLKRKERLYNNKTLHFVAVSNWLKGKSHESNLLKNQHVSVIPNAFPVEEFSSQAHKSRKEYGFPEGKPIIVMGAARLDDPIKGLDIAIEALNKLVDTYATAVFFGAVRNPNAFHKLKLPYVATGPVNDPVMLHDIYAHADIVLSTSHYETLPGTLIEGMAAGCVPVTFGRGGQGDIVDHMRTGYIAEYPNPEDIAKGIRLALDGHFDKSLLRESMAEKFSSAKIARQYISLFESIL